MESIESIEENEISINIILLPHRYTIIKLYNESDTNPTLNHHFSPSIFLSSPLTTIYKTSESFANYPSHLPSYSQPFQSPIDRNYSHSQQSSAQPFRKKPLSSSHHLHAPDQAAKLAPQSKRTRGVFEFICARENFNRGSIRALQTLAVTYYTISSPVRPVEREAKGARRTGEKTGKT